MTAHPDVDSAIDEIVNEAFSVDAEAIVKINLDRAKKLTPAQKKKIESCFDDVLRLLDFNSRAYDIFRRWYVDGRLSFHALIDNDQTEAGIRELRYIDPRKIRKIKEIVRIPVQTQNNSSGGANQVIAQAIKNEYYLYNDKGFVRSPTPVGEQPTTFQGVRIAKDTVVHCTSGITDSGGMMTLSHLHVAIKYLNQLKMLEDAVVIYRLSRAPERRVWYIDIGNLPRIKAEQYMKDIMTKHKNKVVYDSSSGQIRDDRKFMTMLEDYWLPRREGGRGTEVTTLQAGQNLGKMEDVEYFQKKLYNALHVPYSRLNDDSPFQTGKGAEITNAEQKFTKFVARLRTRFSILFTEILKKQVILTKAMTLDEWEAIESYIRYDYTFDMSFEEFKEQELMQSRLMTLQSLTDLGAVGTYYSHDWVRKNILRQSEQDIKEQDEKIEEEREDPRWQGMAMGQAGDEEEDPHQTGEDVPFDDEEEEKHRQDVLVMAKKTYDRLKGMPNKTTAQKTELRSASQIIAKNKM